MFQVTLTRFIVTSSIGNTNYNMKMMAMKRWKKS